MKAMKAMKSHPSWVCGLKHWNQDRADRWHVSHPSWVCGLKHISDEENAREILSHPSWVCGLKQPHLDKQNYRNRGHTLRGCVD